MQVSGLLALYASAAEETHGLAKIFSLLAQDALLILGSKRSSKGGVRFGFSNTAERTELSLSRLSLLSSSGGKFGFEAADALTTGYLSAASRLKTSSGADLLRAAAARTAAEYL